jgi:urea transport system permease protein
MRGLCALCLGVVALVMTSGAIAASPPELLRDVALGDAEAKVTAIRALGSSGDPAALALLQALLDGEVQTVDDKDVLLVKGDTATDLLTGKVVSPVPANHEDVVINNRLRREIGSAMAGLKLTSPDRAIRFAAAKELQNGADEDLLPAISAALAKESDSEIKGMLQLTQASIQLSSPDKATRLAALRALADSNHSSTKTLLPGVLAQNNGSRSSRTPRSAPRRRGSVFRAEPLSTGEMVGRVFSGISLGSILLLAALGLAITYGLMGVINMAHGD